jgi:hypothetical protein
MLYERWNIKICIDKIQPSISHMNLNRPRLILHWKGGPSVLHIKHAISVLSLTKWLYGDCTWKWSKPRPTQNLRRYPDIETATPARQGSPFQGACLFWNCICFQTAILLWLVCRQQAEVIQRHKHVNVCNIEHGEFRHSRGAQVTYVG